MDNFQSTTSIGPPKWMSIKALLCLCFQFLTLAEKAWICIQVSKFFRICSLSKTSVNAISSTHSINLNPTYINVVQRKKRLFFNSDFAKTGCITDIEIKAPFVFNGILKAVSNMPKLQSITFQDWEDDGDDIQSDCDCDEYDHDIQKGCETAITEFLYVGQGDKENKELFVEPISVRELSIALPIHWTDFIGELLNCFTSLISLTLFDCRININLFTHLAQYTPQLECLCLSRYVSYLHNNNNQLELAPALPTLGLSVPGLRNLTILQLQQVPVICDAFVQCICECTNLVILQINLDKEETDSDSVSGHFRTSIFEEYQETPSYSNLKNILLNGIQHEDFIMLSLTQLKILTMSLMNLQFLDLNQQPIMDEISTLEMIATNCRALKGLKCFIPININKSTSQDLHIQMVIEVLNELKNLIVLDLSFLKQPRTWQVVNQFIVPFLLKLKYTKYFYPCIINQSGSGSSRIDTLDYNVGEQTINLHESMCKTLREKNSINEIDQITVKRKIFLSLMQLELHNDSNSNNLQGFAEFSFSDLFQRRFYYRLQPSTI